MNSKRVKLRVASACTAALMVGSMMASSASVFAVVGENHPGRDNTAQESTMVQGRDEVAVQREQIERWTQELEQLKARVSEKMDESMRCYQQVLHEAEADLERDRETEIALQAQMEKEPNNVLLIRELEFRRDRVGYVKRRESFVAQARDSIERQQEFCTSMTTIISELRDKFQTVANKLIASAQELEQYKRNLETQPNDRNYIKLRHYEQILLVRKVIAQRSFQNLKNQCQKAISCLEKNYNGWEWEFRRGQEQLRYLEEHLRSIEELLGDCGK